MGQIRDAFPVPGRYHFRFKSPLMPGGDRDKDGMAVWMDCVKDNQPVPTWRNTIVAKVTRTGVEDDEDDDDDFLHGGGAVQQNRAAPPPRAAPAPAPPHQSAPRTQSHSPAPDLDIFGGPSPPAAQAAMPTSAPNTGNLLDGHHHPAPAPASGGLLDMDTPYGGANNNAHSDFLGMTAPAPASGGYNPQHQQQQQQPRQQQQQQPQQSQQNAFNNFNQQQGPFGGLNWS